MGDYKYDRNDKHHKDENSNNCECENVSNDCCHSNGCGTNFREAVCIHTDKIMDSCREQHCSSYIFLKCN